MPTAKQIVIDYLTSHGYDGLYNEDECGCKLRDLAPCGEISAYCTPGYLITSANGDWCIGERIQH